MGERTDHLAGMTLSFVIGAALGAGVALLFAPASGEETRKKIKEYGEKTMETGKEKVQETIAKAKSRLRHEVSEEVEA